MQREHEQMFWIQRHMSEQRTNNRLASLAASHPRFGNPILPRLTESQDPESMWLEDKWQNFSKVDRNALLREKRLQDAADLVEEEERMLGDSEEHHYQGEKGH